MDVRSGSVGPDPASPSSVRVFQDTLGHWYASFVVPAQSQPLPETGRVLGIDWGVQAIAVTTSDAHDLPHPQHGKKAATQLAYYQRQMARRRPTKGQAPSRGYQAARRLVAKAQKKVARQRHDTTRKWAKHVVRDHDVVAVEDFRPQFLDTTMDCATCGARAKHRLPLSERIYRCTTCGVTVPRDKNSAFVTLRRAGLDPAGVDRVRLDRPPGSRAACARNSPRTRRGSIQADMERGGVQEAVFKAPDGHERYPSRLA